MNWTWSLRTEDGGMNGLEFARCTTAGDLTRVLVHAAPARLHLEVRDSDGALVAAGGVERQGDYSPMTLVELRGGSPTRREVWPSSEHEGLPVLLCGREVGRLLSWYDADHVWWRWSVEFSNTTTGQQDWSPPDG